ncbi:amino acid transporter [Bacillus ectoiniformans]|uniref:APC family permease n=1 Tax=Bacillus ectoiniformans TaxID=1494429 RepID=UPI00195821E7|nr:APC family permease [Bacillus ectoiniformans]MBM7648539.1 amino acid transporter [Bacillus ectoiniformans]
MDNNKQEMKKVLSKTDVLFLAIGAMLGWGWVVLSGNWILEAGSIGAIIAFVIGGLLVTFVGLAYAELASAMPDSGGINYHVNRAMGRKASFIASWAITLGYVSVVTFEAVALPTVVDYLIPNYQTGYLWTIAGWDVYLTWVLIGSVGAILLTILNYIGVKEAAVAQVVLTSAIVLIGLLLVFGSTINGDTSNLDPFFVDGAAGIMGVLIMIPFLFVGFDVIPQVAREANIPGRDVGKILIVSVACAVIFYLMVAFGVSMVLDDEALKSSQLATADAMAAAFGSPIFAKILIIGGICGIVTSWNAFIIGGSRVIYSMAHNGMLPNWFGQLHPKYKTPTNAIVFLGGLAVFAPLLGRPALVWIVDAGGLGIVIAYFLVAVSFIKLRKNEPEMDRPFKAGKSNAIGWLAVIMSFGFIALYMPGMPAALIWPYEWILFAGWAGIGVYFFWQMTREKYQNKEKSEKRRVG